MVFSVNSENFQKENMFSVYNNFNCSKEVQIITRLTTLILHELQLK